MGNAIKETRALRKQAKGRLLSRGLLIGPEAHDMKTNVRGAAVCTPHIKLLHPRQNAGANVGGVPFGTTWARRVPEMASEMESLC